MQYKILLKSISITNYNTFLKRISITFVNYFGKVAQNTKYKILFTKAIETQNTLKVGGMNQVFQSALTEAYQALSIEGL